MKFFLLLFLFIVSLNIFSVENEIFEAVKNEYVCVEYNDNGFLKTFKGKLQTIEKDYIIGIDYEGNLIKLDKLKISNLKVIVKTEEISKELLSEKNKIEINSNKLSIEMEKTKFREINHPVDSASIFNFETVFGLAGMTSNHMEIIMFVYGFSLGFQYLDPSGNFPNKEGGSVGGLDFTLNLGLTGNYSAVSMKSIEYVEYDGYGWDEQVVTKTSNNMFNFNAAITLAYSFFNFKAIRNLDDAENYHKNGSAGGGWSFGVRVMFEKTISDKNTLDTNPISFAPVIGYQSVNFNPGATSISVSKVSFLFLIIPMGDTFLLGFTLSTKWGGGGV